MLWTRINAAGRLLEAGLRWMVLLTLVVVSLLLVLRYEWAMVPAEERHEILCGELFSNTASSFRLPWRSAKTDQRSEDLKGYLDQCERNYEASLMLPPPGGHTLWAISSRTIRPLF